MVQNDGRRRACHETTLLITSNTRTATTSDDAVPLAKESSSYDDNARTREGANSNKESRVDELVERRQDYYWILLSLACLAALLQDASEVALLSTWILPAAWLALGVACGDRRRRFFVTASIVIVTLRAVPAMDYFLLRNDANSGICDGVGYHYLGVWLQVQVWSVCDTRHKKNQHGLLPCDARHDIFIFPILATVVHQVLLRASPIGGTGSWAMDAARVPVVRQVASLVGEIGIVFWTTWTATVVVGAFARHRRPQNATCAPHLHGRVCPLALVWRNSRERWPRLLFTRYSSMVRCYRTIVAGVLLDTSGQ